jgi:hypothetical protein
MKKQTTTLLIRPAARGGKYLGHDAANAQNQSALVAIRNMASGEIVAAAFAVAPDANSAGPPDLMAPVSRSAPYAADGKTVGVTLTVEITKPTDCRVMVFGPLSHLDQARLAQADITVLPGVDIGASPDFPEGLVIEIPGLCISNVTANLCGAQLSCAAKVTMMCGCPIGNKPEWFWPDTDFSVTLVTRTQSDALYHYPLAFEALPNPNVNSLFSGAWPNLAPHDPVVEAWLYAAQPKLGNQGKYAIFPAPGLTLPAEVQAAIVEAALQLT